MERVEKYKSIAKSIIQEVADRPATYSFPLTDHTIFDDERGHYLLFKDGWKGPRRVYGNVIHIGVTEEGRVWLHHDGTDLIVGQMLLDRGVEKSDLVVGFHSPSMRKDTEFAVS
jgi:hypothetical protein